MGLFGTIGYWLSGLLIWAAPLAGVAGLLYAVKRYRGILVESVGSEQMAEQQKAFSKRFDALLDSEKNAFLLSVGGLSVLLLLLPEVSFWAALSFLLGVASAVATVIVVMSAVNETNVRMLEAARSKGEPAATMLAYSGGSVAGIAAQSLCIAGVGFLFYFFGSEEWANALTGYALGAVFSSLFPRAAVDENAHTAHRALNLFGSAAAALVAAIVIGGMVSVDDLQYLTGYTSELGDYLATRYRFILMGTPIVLSALGLIASLFALHVVAREGAVPGGAQFARSVRLATAVYLGLSFLLCILGPLRLWLWFAIAAGATASSVIENIIQASASEKDYRRVWWTAGVLCAALLIANFSGGIYGAALAAVSMMATLTLSVTAVTFGYIAESAPHQSSADGSDGSNEQSLLSSIGAVRKAAHTLVQAEDQFSVLAAALSTLTVLSAYGLYTGGYSGLPLVDQSTLIGLLAGSLLPAVIMTTGQTSLLRVVVPQDSSLSNLVPGSLAVEAPVAAALLLGATGLGGVVAGAVTCGLILSLFLAVSGEAAPAKGTSSAISILIKTMAIVALVIAPVI